MGRIKNWEWLLPLGSLWEEVEVVAEGFFFKDNLSL
jgi:hypothetical protein